MSDDVPDPQPLSNLNEGAIHLHEMYTAYMEAGFSKEQAFELVTNVLLHYLDSD